METQLKLVGSKIKQLRKEKGLRQTDVADGTGISYRHYQEIESGRVNVTVSTLGRIAEFLKLPIQSFFVESAPVEQRATAND